MSTETIDITAKPTPSSGFAIVACFGAVAVVLLAGGRREYPSLHGILDTCLMVVSGVLAWFFWDLGTRLDQLLPRRLAASFGVASLLKLLHVLTAVDWWGSLAPLAEATGGLRPVIWPAAVHALPLGIGAAILLRKRAVRTAWFVTVLLLAGVVWVLVFSAIPSYTAPVWLGITRPFLFLAPLLWVAVAILCRRLRAEDRLHQPLCAMALVLGAGDLGMFYSQAPGDTPAIAAHLVWVAGFLMLLAAMMRFASWDAKKVAQTQQALAAVNEQLEARVREACDDLRAAQQKMVQQERMRSVGEMASGIAHEINNAITPAALYAEELLEREKALSPRSRRQLEIVHQAIHDAGEIIARMRGLYRPKEPSQAFAPIGPDPPTGEASPAHPPQPPAAKPTGKTPPGRKLLVVDDDPVLLDALRDVLEQDGHRVVTSPGAQAALEIFRSALTEGDTFDLVFTDLVMPEMAGDLLAAAIKEISPHTPLLLLTGFGSRLIAEKKLPPHVDEVLSKPPRLRDLRAALARWSVSGDCTN